MNRFGAAFDFRPYTSTMSKITRDTFISKDHAKIALNQKNMFVHTEGERGVKEVPIPETAKSTGILPEGTRVDFIVDPDTIVVSLAEQNITTVEQLPEGLLERLKGIANSPDNLRIVPTSVYEGKRESVQNTLRIGPGDN